MIILWQNILVHQQGALNSLLTTIPNRNYRANRSGLILQKKIRKFAENKQISRQTHRHTDREFNYRGHSYPLWIVGGSGPIVTNLQPNFISTSFRVSKPVAGFVVVLTLFQKGYRCNSYLYGDSIASINIYEHMY